MRMPALAAPAMESGGCERWVGSRLLYAWDIDAISFTTMAAGPVSHGNTQVQLQESIASNQAQIPSSPYGDEGIWAWFEAIDSWRRVGGAQKVQASTSCHVTMESFFQLVQVG